MNASMIDPQLPLIDLHRHLDGSVRLATILELGQRHGVKRHVFKRVNRFLAGDWLAPATGAPLINTGLQAGALPITTMASRFNFNGLTRFAHSSPRSTR